MTILVGMVGSDGIVLATDQCMIRPAGDAGEFDGRMRICKIERLEKHKVVYAGAGDNIPRNVGRELSRRLDVNGFDFQNIADSLEKIALQVIEDERAKLKDGHYEFVEDRPRSLLIVFY